MAEFKFYQEKKLTVWERTYFSVSADSVEEAIKKVEEVKDTDVFYCDQFEKIGDSELLHDVMEEMSVEDNQGWATIETYDEEGELLFANGKH